MQFYRPLFLSLLFVAQKVTKRHSTDKISRSALLLTNFRTRKFPSVGRYLSATFPTERLRGSVKVKPRIRRAKKTFTLLSAPFLRTLPVILTMLYLLKVTFATKFTMYSLLGTLGVKVHIGKRNIRVATKINGKKTWGLKK